jgi:hypothetical protein
MAGRRHNSPATVAGGRGGYLPKRQLCRMIWQGGLRMLTNDAIEKTMTAAPETPEDLQHSFYDGEGHETGGPDEPEERANVLFRK